MQRDEADLLDEKFKGAVRRVFCVPHKTMPHQDHPRHSRCVLFVRTMHAPWYVYRVGISYSVKAVLQNWSVFPERPLKYPEVLDVLSVGVNALFPMCVLDRCASELQMATRKLEVFEEVLNSA